MILYVNGAGWGNTEPVSGLKKKISYPLKTRLLNFNPVSLGAGRDGYPKKPVPLPSLNSGVQMWVDSIFYPGE